MKYKKILFSLVYLPSLLMSQIILNQPIKNFNLLDQFSKPHTIQNSTKKLIFAFRKNSGHMVKNFLKTKEADYLTKKDILFVADVSTMPSIIKLFVLPIKGYDYPIVTLDNNQIAKYYQNEKQIEKIMIVTLDKTIVTKIDYVNNLNDLEKEINF